MAFCVGRRRTLDISPDIKRFGEHRNAFGFLRLLLASLVIASHTPEMADGNRSREVLTRIFGTISFGELAVDGFFLVSGYLIVGSFLKQPEIWPILRKRIARIYPAFLIASLVSLLVVAPLAGASASQLLAQAPRAIARMLLLQQPSIPNIFAGTQFPLLNEALWTIAYEFRCYLIVLVLGLLGVFKRPWLVAALAVLLLATWKLTPPAALKQLDEAIPFAAVWLGEVANSLRLTSIYLVGVLFYLWRDQIHFTRLGAVVAAIGYTALMFFPEMAEAGLAVFGGYLLFALAAWGSSGLISRINNRDDISYGVYLYGWPAGKLLLWYWPTMSLLLVGLLTTAIACLCGWLSWHWVEKPVMRRVR